MQLFTRTETFSIVDKIYAYQIFDSRGKPTVEVSLKLKTGEIFRAAVPSGASTGVHEALELRDQVKDEYLGQGVTKAISNVNNVIVPKLLASELSVCNQKAVDQFLIQLDGTPNKSNLGANAILGVSMVTCLLGAFVCKDPLYQYISNLYGMDSPTLPLPFFNIINGGAHAGNKLPFQEFMIVPTGASSFSDAMKLGSEVYHHLKVILKTKYGQNATNVGDEGGFAPNIAEPLECLQLIMEAIESSGHIGRISIALDVAASEFYQDEKYNLDVKASDIPKEKQRRLSGHELAQFYNNLCANFPSKDDVISIEDPFDQDDWESWTYLRSTLSKDIQVVGDDLTVTNPLRINLAIQKQACNSLLLKINQIGSLTESLEAAQLARKNGWSVMVSHRSGETENSFISDLSVGLGCGQLKSGAPCRSERLAKYNQLIR